MICLKTVASNEWSNWRNFLSSSGLDHAAHQFLEAVGLAIAIGFFLPTPAEATDGSGGGESHPFAASTQIGSTGQFTGAASVTIPIVLPPGRPSLTPTLALNYSSQRGQTPFGFGWDLSLGSVYRLTSYGVPSCDSPHMNRFAVSMNGAVNELSPESSVGRYFLKYDEASTEAVANTSQNSWILTTRDGMEYIFGETPESRIFSGNDAFQSGTSPGCGFTTAWHLTQIRDPNGNAVSITYSKSAGNVSIIDEIHYGGTVTNAGVHPYRIKFELHDEIRTNFLIPVFSSGVKQFVDRYVRRIHVEMRSTSGGAFSTIRSYGLSTIPTDCGLPNTQYCVVSGRSEPWVVLLQHVAISDLPDKAFEYASFNPVLSEVPSKSQPGMNVLARSYVRGSQIALMDLDRDGSLDRICARNSSAWNVEFGGSPDLMFAFAHPWFPSGGVPCSASGSQPGNWPVPNLPNGVGYPNQIRRLKNGPEGQGFLEDEYLSQDVNGDGVIDLLYRESATGIRVYFGGTDGFGRVAPFAPYEVWNNPDGLPLFQSYRRNTSGIYNIKIDSRVIKDLVDINGDRLPDLVRSQPDSSWLVYRNTGSGFETTPLTIPGMDDSIGYVPPQGPDAFNPIKSERALIDVNADGLVDWVVAPEVYRTQNGKVFPYKQFYLVSSQGVSPMLELNSSGTSILCPDNQLVFRICNNSSGVAIVGALSVRLNTGGGFAPPVYSPAPIPSNGSDSGPDKWSFREERFDYYTDESIGVFRDLVDVNGDGRVDIISSQGALINRGDGTFGGNQALPSVSGPDYEPYFVVNYPASTNNGHNYLGSVSSTVPLPALAEANALPLSTSEYDGSWHDTKSAWLDLDGDGIQEKVQTGGSGPDQRWNLTKLIFKSPATGDEHTKPYLLSRVTDSTGGFTQFRYMPTLSTNPETNQGAPGIPFPLWVVSGVRRSDGLCGQNPLPKDWFSLPSSGSPGNPCLAEGHDFVQKFTYRNASFDDMKNELRGFGTVIVQDAPIGIGAVARHTYDQSDALKGRLVATQIYSGSEVETNLVSSTSYSWRSSLRSVFLMERKVENFARDFATLGFGGLSAPPQDQCIVHRSTTRLPVSGVVFDPKNRIRTTCSMSCTGANSSVNDPCAPMVEGKKQTTIEYAEPPANGQQRIYSRPARILKHYTTTANTSGSLYSEEEFQYDGLNAGQIDRGLLSRAARKLNTDGDWQTTNYLYDTDGAPYPGPGNLTSVQEISTRDPRTLQYDSQFRLFPEVEILPRTFGPAGTGPGGSFEHRIQRTYDRATGKVLNTTRVLSASANHVSGSTYDTLGRTICEFQPGTTCQGTTTGSQFNLYFEGIPSSAALADRLNRVEERRREPQAPAGYLRLVTYFDDFGRERFATNEQLDSVTGAIATVVVRHIEYGVNGKELRRYDPYVLTGALGSIPANASFSQTSYVLNGNAEGRLDPAGRVFEVLHSTGSGPANLRFKPQVKYFGNSVFSLTPMGDLSYTRVDEHGRSVLRVSLNQTSTQSVLSQSEARYDGDDRLVEEWFGGDLSTKVLKTYDLGGRPVSTADPDSGTWSRQYDYLGNLTFENDPKPNQSVQSCYDTHDRVVLQCGRASDTFDPGLCASPSPACTRKFTYVYDESGNISGATNLGLGRLTTVAGPSTTIKYLYDVRGRVLRRNDIFLGGTRTATTSFSYRSDLDRVTEMTYPDGEIVKYGYDIAGQPTSLSQVNSSGQWLAWYVMDIKYDIRGRPTRIQRGNATVDTMSYHGASEGFRLLTAKSERPSAGPSDPGDVFLNLRYGDYDENGRIKAITDQRWTTGQLSMTGHYFYDGAGRLISSEITGQQAASSPAAPEQFAYDSIGNMTQKNGRAISFEPGKKHRPIGVPTTATTAWGFHYNENGQRDAKVHTGNTVVQSYAYDPFGNVDQITSNGSTTNYRYDHSGQRVFESSNGSSRYFFDKYSEGIATSNLLVKYYYLGGGVVATRADSAPSLFASGPAIVSPIVVTPAIYWAIMSTAIVLLFAPRASMGNTWAFKSTVRGALGGVLILVASSIPIALNTGCAGDPPIRHLHLGHLGGALAISKIGGDVDRQYRYSAYGEVRRYDRYGVGVALDNENRREYTGYQTDSSSGLQYAGARYYDPAAATFMSHDPRNQLQSPYAYSGWDPINLVDTTGEWTEAPYGSQQPIMFGGFFGTAMGFNGSLQPYATYSGIVLPGTGFDGLSFVNSATNNGAYLLGELLRPAVWLDQNLGPELFTLQMQVAQLPHPLRGAAAFPMVLRGAVRGGSLLDRSLRASGTPAARAGPLSRAYRYVGPGEASIIDKSGLVPNVTRLGQPKNVSLTPLQYRSASQAEEALAIGRFDPRGPGITPTHGVEVDLRGVPLSYGGTGATGVGGIEVQTPAAVRALRIFELEP